MTVRYLIAPATDRVLLRRFLGRIDQILGYPRAHALSEAEVRVSAGGPLPVTETAFVVYVHDAVNDAPILHGAIAVQVDGIAESLRERFLENGSGVRKRLREWIQDQGWEVRPDLPGTRLAWTRIAHRDGAAGSATGVPIPEGSE
jgi:hypothetical protein